MPSLSDFRETISLYWRSAVSLLSEQLNTSTWLCSFRAKVLLTTVTILVLIFAAIGFTVLYHQDACRNLTEQGHRVIVQNNKTRNTQKSHHMTTTTTSRKSKIIEAITTRKRPSLKILKPTTSKIGRPSKRPGLISILSFETTTTTKADYEKNAGLLMHYGTTSAALQLQPKLTDHLFTTLPKRCPSLELFSSGSSSPLESSPPSLICTIFFGTSSVTTDSLDNKLDHHRTTRGLKKSSNPWVRGLLPTTTKRPRSTKDPLKDTFGIPHRTSTARQDEIGILDITTPTPTTSATTSAPVTKSQEEKMAEFKEWFNKWFKEFCRKICIDPRDRGLGGKACNCDDTPMYVLRLSPMTTVEGKADQRR